MRVNDDADAGSDRTDAAASGTREFALDECRAQEVAIVAGQAELDAAGWDRDAAGVDACEIEGVGGVVARCPGGHRQRLAAAVLEPHSRERARTALDTK